MGYEELSHNYFLEIYDKPYLSVIQDKQIMQMSLENILDERNKTQSPREKDRDVFKNKFKEKDLMLKIAQKLMIIKYCK